MNDDNDLSSTVIAKSDQLNADDLIEPITITITRVDKVSSKDQPVNIHSEGRQPFKPCLTMRRMLIAAWGKYKDQWVGQSMVVYCDPEVLWAGKAQGGIRVSHVTGIDKPISKMLAVTRGRKAVFTLLPLKQEGIKTLTDTDHQWIAAVKADSEALNQIEDPEYRAFIQKQVEGA
jgi:hypothetical protein